MTLVAVGGAAVSVAHPVGREGDGGGHHISLTVKASSATGVQDLSQELMQVPGVQEVEWG